MLRPQIFVRMRPEHARQEIASLQAVLAGGGTETERELAPRCAQLDARAIVDGHPGLEAELRAAAEKILAR